MASMNRILIVDDHPMFRSTLRAFLSQEPDFHIVGLAGSLRDAIWQVGSLNPDLVLTDLNMPDARGVEAVSGIKRHYPDVKILVLTLHRESEFVQQCHDAGAAGYIIKDAIHEQLRDGMRAVLSGKTYIAADATNSLGLHYRPGRAAAGESRRRFQQHFSLN